MAGKRRVHLGYLPVHRRMPRHAEAGSEQRAERHVRLRCSSRSPAQLRLVIPGGPDAKYSGHNGFSTTAGDDWVGQIAPAIMYGPLWRSTVLFITWDDCGCFYDQVPPGINPDGTQQGPRVPLVIVSPHAPRVHRHHGHDVRRDPRLRREKLRAEAARGERRAGLPVHERVQLQPDAAATSQDGEQARAALRSHRLGGGPAGHLTGARAPARCRRARPRAGDTRARRR
jgi:Phosphoesterase family